MPKLEEPQEAPEVQAVGEAPKPEANGHAEKPKAKRGKEEVVYPDLDIYHCWAGATTEALDHAGKPLARPPIDAEFMKKILGWREAAEDEAHLLTDEYGKRITCDHNRHNRPFTERDARKYAQDLLNKVWSGPTAFPGETVNGEAFIISRTANVVSGQKRGAGLMLAQQKLDRNPGKYKKLWPEGKVLLETVMVVGVSDDPRVIATLDNVQSRTTGDTFYSNMELWPKVEPGKVRKEMCSMLDSALDLLWKRTGAGAKGSSHEYQSHSAEREFLKRHPRLVTCVEVMHGLDHDEGQRGIAGRGIPPGPAAALMYLMGCGKSDPDAYLQAKPEPNEKALDWSREDKAKQFWEHIAKGRMEAVKSAIKKLKDVGDGLGGRLIEKNAIVVKAWLAYLRLGKNENVKAADLKLDYGTDKNDRPVLNESPVCGGIDHGDQPEPDEEEPEEPKAPKKSKEEIRKEQDEKILAARTASDSAKADAAKVTAQQYKEMTNLQKLDHVQALAGSNRVVLADVQGKNWRAYGASAANACGKILKLVVHQNKEGISFADVKNDDLDAFAARLQQAGYPVSLARFDPKTKLPVVKDWEPAPAKKAKPKK